MKASPRYLSPIIHQDLSEKMVFLGGPRQVGKTTLSRDLVPGQLKSSYFNWDQISSRRSALKGEWPADVSLIILDEFHKHPKWKSWLKGEYDMYKERYRFLLTGSARLNIFRRGGDSLQGRYHYYVLHPFSLAELAGLSPQFNVLEEPCFHESYSEKAMESLFHFGGFPEPFLKQDSRFLRRWKNERVERFFQEDIRELTMIKDFGNLTLLADLLPDRVSSVLSINSIAEDLQVNFRTVARWLDSFEQFYYSYRLAPYQSRKIASVKKEKKLYLWDWSEIVDEGARFENMVGSHLLKFCDFLHDYDGQKIELHYLRDSTGREVDFLVSIANKPWFAVEVKSSDKMLSKNMLYFKEKLAIPFCYQVVRNCKKERMQQGVHIIPAAKFLSAFV